MNFFAVFLRKLEPSCEIGAYSTAIFRKVPYRKWPPLALSWSQCFALFAVITSTEVWNPNIGEEIVCFAEEENSHHRKAVISRQTTSPSVTLLPNSSGASTAVKYCSRGVYSH